MGIGDTIFESINTMLDELYEWYSDYANEGQYRKVIIEVIACHLRSTHILDRLDHAGSSCNCTQNDFIEGATDFLDKYVEDHPPEDFD